MRELLRIRIGLRCLFGLVTLFCVWIVTFTAVPRYQRKTEAAIAAKIRNVGGRAQYARVPVLGSTLFSAVGIGYIYDRIRAVDLGEASLNVDLCRQLASLKHLKFVWLNSSTVDGQCLAALSAAPALHGLDLSDTRVCDADLLVLANLESLRWLKTIGSNVTRDSIVKLEELLQSDQLVEQWTTDRLRMRKDARISFKTGSDGRPVEVTCSGPCSHQDLNDFQFLTRLTRVRLAGQIPKHGLIHFKHLPRLRELTLFEADIEDADLEHLNGLTDLRELAIYRAKINGEGLRYLTKMSSLDTLSLAGTDVSDVGMVHLTKMFNLRHLDLSDTNVTNDGLKYLTGLRRLKYLNLGDTSISDDGLKNLTELCNLDVLDLDGTSVSNGGLKHLAGLSCLEYLGLSGTSVSNDGLKHLRKLTELQVLRLARTKVTASGTARLKTFLGPQCTIERRW